MTRKEASQTKPNKRAKSFSLALFLPDEEIVVRLFVLTPRLFNVGPVKLGLS